MQISIKSNIKEAPRNLTRAERTQLPFAASKTLNDMARKLAKPSKKGVGVIGKAANKTFKKKSGAPGATEFTRKNWFYKKSNKQNLTAEVFWDESNADYMKFQVSGGTRFPRKRAIQVSTRHSKSLLDRFGNIKREQVSAILEDRSKYFIGVPRGLGIESAGIWERTGRNKRHPGGQKIRMVVAYESQGNYRPLFPFVKTAEGFVFSRDDGFAKIFRKNLDLALRTRRRR